VQSGSSSDCTAGCGNDGGLTPWMPFVSRWWPANDRYAAPDMAYPLLPPAAGRHGRHPRIPTDVSDTFDGPPRKMVLKCLHD
jgi:hypothetical protein